MNRTHISLLLASASLGGIARAQALSETLVTAGLDLPVAVIQDPLDANVQFVLQQTGAVRTVVGGTLQPTPFLTLPVLNGSERGLLGMAFPPDHALTGSFYLHFTTSGVFMQVARFSRVGSSLTADPATRFDIFRTQRPFANHNSGTIHFGPDGLLYIPTGDGGGVNDPGNRGQTATEILGKMARIDPRTDDFPGDALKNYAIPPSNPFLPINNPPISSLPEIWSFGLRNVWKFAFDSPELLGTGAMVMADVGQGAREEVNYEPAGRGGRNYGWKRFEGTLLNSAGTALAYSPHTPPIYEYTHADGLSITGGRVYRGLQLGPEYFGRYFFADYVSGRVWSIALTVDAVTGEATSSDLREHSGDFFGALGNVSSIDQNASGELLVTNYGGSVHRISRPETVWVSDLMIAPGAIVQGQIRSLVLADGKTVIVQPIRTSATAPRRAGITVGAFSNRGTTDVVQFEFQGRVTANVGATVELYARNWTTNAFDLVQTDTWNATLKTTQTGVLDAATYLRSSDQRVEARAIVSYGGILPTPGYRVVFDRVAVNGA